MKLMQSLVLAAASAVLTLSSPTLLAHSDEHLDTQKAGNGGQLRMAGAYHFELVAKDGAVIAVHVTDHAGTKVPTAGASGTATILAGKTKTTATLVPDGDNRMKGSARYVLSPDLKVVVLITLPGKPAEQARFTPLVVAREALVSHQH